jgi:hypothetical protein
MRVDFEPTTVFVTDGARYLGPVPLDAERKIKKHQKVLRQDGALFTYVVVARTLPEARRAWYDMRGKYGYGARGGDSPDE